MSQRLQELRSAWRALRAAPLTTGAAIVVLALGTGVNLAVFAVAYGVLLRPLPWPEPERLGIVSLVSGDGADFGFHADRVEEWRSRLRTVESFAAYAQGEGTLRGAGEPRLLKIAWATPELFDVLGTDGERTVAFREEPGALVLSDRSARRLGGADRVVGRPLTLGTQPVVPVAVTAPGAGFPSEAIDGWTRWERPPAATPEGTLTGPDTRSFRFLIRLAPGVSWEQAREDAGRVFRELVGPAPASLGGAPATRARPTVTPVTEAAVGGARPVLGAALGAALLVLLVTCGNVAMLLLGRAVVRRRESAIRLALGAGGWRLVRGALAESLLLAAAGAVAGLALAAAALRLFRATAGGSFAADLVPLAQVRAGAVALDAPVLAGAVALVFLVTVLAGTAPALHAACGHAAGGLGGSKGPSGKGGGLAETLRAAGPSTSAGSAGKTTRRLLAGLVAAQIAASVVLLAGAALLARTVVRLMEQDAGFEPERVLTVRLAEPLEDGAADEVLARVRALPGVGSAGLGSALPPADAPFRIHVRRLAEGVDEGLSMSVVAATAGFLDSLGVEPVAGRLFTEEDERFRAPVLLLSESAARHYFAQAPSDGAPGGTVGPPAASLVGRELPGRLPPIARFGDAPPRIVGVVPDVKYAGLDQPAAAAVYLPWYAGWGPTAHLAVRSRGAGGPAGEGHLLAAAVRREVREAAPAMPIPAVRTLEEEMAHSIGDRRLRAIPAVGFAAVALAVALTGVAALFLRAAAERRHEVAVRIALGATDTRIVAMMLRGALAVTGAGLVAGLAAAALFTAGLRGLLFGIGPHDPATLAAVVLAVAAACLLAAWLPARRAARVQPAELLRGE